MFTKNRGLFNLIQIISLLIIFLFAFFIIKPSIQKIQKELLNKKEQVLTTIEEKYGLDISYASISPLLVDSIIIKKLVVKTGDEREYVSIDDVRIKLNLFTLISGLWIPEEPGSFISSVYISDGIVKLDLDDPWFKALFTDSESSGQIINTKVFAKNMNLDITQKDVDIEVREIFGSIKGSFHRYFVDVSANATVILRFDSPITRISGHVKSKGFLSSNFKNIETDTYLSQVDSDIGTFQDINGLVDIEDDQVNVRIDNRDFLFVYKLKIDIMENFFYLKSKKFSINDIFKSNGNFNIFDPYINSYISGEVSRNTF